MSRSKANSEKSVEKQTEKPVETPVFTNKTYGVARCEETGKWTLYMIQYNPDTGDTGKPEAVYSDEYRDIVIEHFRIEVGNANFGHEIEL